MLSAQEATPPAYPFMVQGRVEHWTWHGVDVTLAVLSHRHMVVGAALWHDPEQARPWRASLHMARGKDPALAMFYLDEARWTSAAYAQPKTPVDALLAHMALLLLPVEAYSLRAALLPPD